MIHLYDANRPLFIIHLYGSFFRHLIVLALMVDQSSDDQMAKKDRFTIPPPQFATMLFLSYIKGLRQERIITFRKLIVLALMVDQSSGMSSSPNHVLISFQRYLCSFIQKNRSLIYF